MTSQNRRALAPAIVICLSVLAACDAREDEVRTAATIGASAALAAEVAEETNKATDYDAIAQEAVSDVDTSDFDALTK
ncbi:hypothetical protein [uncultured Ruegeria sp.]|uniref:hypothetical protein n=1 Tax=uncultured Ruegeria sp. TaxID=259304 RepID=UPI00262E4FEF|nr:hypothetical protein [uncultured Ruegeria sp.]